MHSYDDMKEAINYIYYLCNSEEEGGRLEDLDLTLQKLRSSGLKGINLKEQIKSDYEHMKSIERRFRHTRSVPVRRVVITPSSIEFKFMTRNMENRVIRKFKNNLEDFIRVSFQGENHSAQRYNRDNNEPLLKHIKEIMTNGFKLAGKTFIFLHYSNSQMKAHSCWFMNETEINYENVIESLGNFETETKLSKNASRKGQAFSSAINVAVLNYETEVEEIDDIERNGFTFSDGCGEILHSFAKEIADRKFDTVNCFAYQIRMGGCKGVLVSSKNEFKGDVKVKIRKSMKKFERKEEDKKVDLDVIRMATYSHGYLNKQIIAILWSNGVEPKVFLDMQKAYVEDILNIYKLDKFKFKDDYPFMLFSSIKFLDYKLHSVHKEGRVDYYSDPFIGPLIKLVCYTKFKELRKRFRVFDKNCCVLMGVIDPYD